MKNSEELGSINSNRIIEFLGQFRFKEKLSSLNSNIATPFELAYLNAMRYEKQMPIQKDHKVLGREY